VALAAAVVAVVAGMVVVAVSARVTVVLDSPTCRPRETQDHRAICSDGKSDPRYLVQSLDQGTTIRKPLGIPSSLKTTIMLIR
jgi:hypothetical protein